VVGFTQDEVATFIAMVGIMSVVAQTFIMGLLMKNVGPRKTIIVGLVFEMVQLAWYGFGSQTWMMWAAGILAALSSITYPAISSFVSTHSDPDKQGIVEKDFFGELEIKTLCCIL
jgi:MFS family permease